MFDVLSCRSDDEAGHGKQRVAESSDAGKREVTSMFTAEQVGWEGKVERDVDHLATCQRIV